MFAGVSAKRPYSSAVLLWNLHYSVGITEDTERASQGSPLRFCVFVALDDLVKRSHCSDGKDWRRKSRIWQTKRLKLLTRWGMMLRIAAAAGADEYSEADT